MFLPQEIVRKKRDGQALSKEDITRFVRGIAEGSVYERNCLFAFKAC